MAKTQKKQTKHLERHTKQNHGLRQEEKFI